MESTIEQTRRKAPQAEGVPFAKQNGKNPGPAIKQYQFTAVTTILKGQSETLFKLLASFGKTLSKDPFIPFQQLNKIHYCRWFIIDEATDSNNRPVPPLLVFSFVVDGDIRQNLEQLIHHGEEGIEKIYSHIEGYPSGSSLEARVDYLMNNRHVEPLFWAAKSHGTVELIRKEALLRNEIQSFISTWQEKENLRSIHPTQVYGTILSHIRNHPDFSWALIPPEMEESGLKKWLSHNANLLFKIVALPLAIILLPLLAAWFLLARYFEIRNNKRIPPPQRKPLHEVVEYEDRIFQNQLTIYGTLKKPFWFYKLTLNTFLKIANLKMKLTATKGNLSGIATIHFVSWVFFNDKRNVMFLSNYDGGWESYLNEFIDEAASVMNLSFGSMIGYPPTRWIFADGAHDEQEFKTVVRDHQYPCPIWYSAYPMQSIKNILNNSAIRKGIATPLTTEKDIANWLKLL